MKGTRAFMKRIAYMTPSGSPPHSRISTTSAPIPMPKIQQPAFVVGEVTMSVAMYHAPSMRPPLKSMKSASGWRSGATACAICDSTATVARIETGMRQLRWLRSAR